MSEVFSLFLWYLYTSFCVTPTLKIGKNADSYSWSVREYSHSVKIVWRQSEFAFFGVQADCLHSFLIQSCLSDTDNDILLVQAKY